MAMIGVAYSIGFTVGPMIGAGMSTMARANDEFFCLPACFALAICIFDIFFAYMFVSETLKQENRSKVSNRLTFSLLISHFSHLWLRQLMQWTWLIRKRYFSIAQESFIEPEMTRINRKRPEILKCQKSKIDWFRKVWSINNWIILLFCIYSSFLVSSSSKEWKTTFILLVATAVLLLFTVVGLGLG